MPVYVGKYNLVLQHHQYTYSFYNVSIYRCRQHVNSTPAHSTPLYVTTGFPTEMLDVLAVACTTNSSRQVLSLQHQHLSRYSHLRCVTCDVTIPTLCYVFLFKLPKGTLARFYQNLSLDCSVDQSKVYRCASFAHLKYLVSTGRGQAVFYDNVYYK